SIFRQRLRDPRRRKQKLAPTAEEAVEHIPLPSTEGGQEKPSLPPRVARELGHLEEIYRALVLGTRDYVLKNGFRRVVIGLSGGIDSSLTTTIAADALGRESVVGVFMPSCYSSQESHADAQELARNLGVQLMIVPIDGAFQAYLGMLDEAFTGRERDVTEENLQARIRGNILMALSNKFGWLVLATGNKSEMSVGYATLYGDMAGGFAVIKDVPKTLVYELARYRNSLGPVIPERVLAKAPTAELRPNQRDEDSLPPYAILDPILQAYVEEDRSLAEIVAQGFDQRVVHETMAMVDRSEYKRRQAPPGIKITPRAFGKDRRLPITNRYRSHGP
ncbi:MAG: NAD(+) synthase, partial [Chloroflexi bacterium]|nr:NAD(+) synthase [Chloroflexota bacterium]